MKITIKISCAVAVSLILMFTGCNKDLVEHPEATLNAVYLNSSAGALAGISGVYSDLRNLWGTEGFTAFTVAGTDDYLAGSSASSLTLYTYNNVDPNSGAGLWGIGYQAINTLDGVLKYLPSVSFSTSHSTDSTTRALYTGQCLFLRGMLYFYMIQSFGAIPLHNTFITTPTTVDTRSSLDSCYIQVISDLTAASTLLSATPVAPFLGKPATQPTALFLLAKTYLTRGWSSVAQPTDFQTAYTIATTLIANASKYGLGLWPDFYQANKNGNEYGQESLMVIDHSTNPTYGSYVQNAAGGVVNISASLFRPNYPTVNANYPASGGSSVMVRDVQNGRPFIRTRPSTNYILNEAFADLVNDARYWKTFQTVWIENQNGITTPRGTLIKGVDTAIWMPPYDVSAATYARFKGIILTPTGANGPTSGTKTSAYTTTYFPACKKFDDTTRVNVNDPSSRPFIMFRFADVYLIAAEAAFKNGDNTDAANLINVIRERAAYWAGDPNYATKKANMDITPAQVTLDFILDERTREFYGESCRWWDLVRTQSLLRRTQIWNTDVFAPGTTTLYEQPYNALRPIPVGAEFDLLTPGTFGPGTNFPQNPGYSD